VLSGQDNDYLPHWMHAAGYRTECKLDSDGDCNFKLTGIYLDIGKIMNGYGLSNYNVKSKGWDLSDLLARFNFLFYFKTYEFAGL
jgi:hypothetical protein